MTMETERLIDKEELQQRLDVIESRAMFVAGYLNMLKQLGAIHPRFFAECDDHLNELSEVAAAVIAVKEELGLRTNLKNPEKITFAVKSAVNRQHEASSKASDQDKE